MIKLRIGIPEELSEISRVNNIFFTFCYIVVNSLTTARAYGGIL